MCVRARARAHVQQLIHSIPIKQIYISIFIYFFDSVGIFWGGKKSREHFSAIGHVLPRYEIIQFGPF